jgi:VIT1/CCC1 family predicted Fe2+/Mn2+ transporter
LLDLRKLSFGGPAAIVTSMALIAGLGTAAAAKSALVPSLLIIGIADNLTDSLSVHIYQESERLEEADAFRTTVTNFFVRLLIALSFVAIVATVKDPLAIYLCIAWGFGLLATLSYFLAVLRKVKPFPEMWKHSTVAVGVIAISMAIGKLVAFAVG